MVFQKTVTTLWVVGSIPTHSNVIVQLVRTIEGYVGSNPATNLVWFRRAASRLYRLKICKTEFIHSLK